MAASAYHVYQGRWKITSLDTIDFFDKHVCINNPHWQSSGIIIFLWKYYSFFRYTGSLSLGCALFTACCSIIRASWETKKKSRWVTEKSTEKNLCEGHHFFDCTSSFYVIFLLLSSSTAFPSDVLAEWPST